ncbi:Putative periplasmic substrate-binding transport protein [Bordetella tumbae]|uniref:TRAP transporter substrate-binding protein n=1 Tax=Bordetella tumbae TaxID=1649139 RepID=UPI0039F08B2F
MKYTAKAWLATLALSLVIPAGAWAQSILKIGWTTTDSPDDPYALAAHYFSDALKESAGDSITVQYYPNRQLGDEKQMLEGLRFGTVDAAVITNSVVAQLEPAFGLNDLPFLYASANNAYQVLDGAVGEQLAKKLEAKGVIVLGFTEGGFRHMLNNKRPVAAPEDVKGVKYRVMQNPVFIDMFNAMHGSAVPMAWGETFTAVQQGTIDGLEVPLAVAAGNKLYEVTKFLSLTGHSYSTNLLLISKRAFNKLTPEQQQQVIAAGKKATDAQRVKSAQNDAALRKVMADNGMAVNEITDVSAFRSAVAPLYDKYRPKVGSALLDQALNSAQ